MTPRTPLIVADRFFSHIEPQACPYVVTFLLPVESFQAMKNRFYEEKIARSPILLKGFRNGKAPRSLVEAHLGGPSQAYRPLLCDLVADTAFWKTNRIVLSVISVNVTEHRTQAEIAGTVYFLPRVYIPEDLELASLLPPEEPLDDSAVAELVEQQIARVVAEGIKFVVKKGAAARGDYVTLSIDASIDRRPWPGGSFSSGRLLLEEGKIHPSALLDSIVGREAGDKWKQTITLGEEFGKLQGQQVTQKVKLYSVTTGHAPPFETAAQSLGFSSLDSWKASVAADVRSRLGAVARSKRIDELLSRLLPQCEMEPIPSEWVSAYAQSRIDQLKDKQDLDALFDTFSQEGAIKLRKELCLLALGERLALLYNRPSLGQLPEYFQKVAERILEQGNAG